MSKRLTDTVSVEGSLWKDCEVKTEILDSLSVG